MKLPQSNQNFWGKNNQIEDNTAQKLNFARLYPNGQFKLLQLGNNINQMTRFGDL